MDLDPCIERAGVYLVHFSAYQPQEYATEEILSKRSSDGECDSRF